MNIISKLQSSQWQYRRNFAELIYNDELLMQIKFKKGTAYVDTQDHHWQIERRGFFCSAISVTENNKIVLSQNRIGFWQSKTEICIGDKEYISKIKHSLLPAIAYGTETEPILEYRVNSFWRKPRFLFHILSTSISENDLLLLTAAGFYSLRNLVNEYNAAAATTAVIVASS